jgi:hypothetical protein
MGGFDYGSCIEHYIPAPQGTRSGVGPGYARAVWGKHWLGHTKPRLGGMTGRTCQWRTDLPESRQSTRWRIVP